MPSAPKVGTDEDTLVRDHLPLVSYAVSEIGARIPRHVTRDDLVSAGMLGLAQAARTFDQSRGADFASFARVRIRGAILDELRSRDWASRSVRGFARRADAAVERLTADLQRTPTAREVADRLGVDARTLDGLAADVDRATVLNYESIVLGGDGEEVLPAAASSPEAQLLAKERCAYLYDAVGALPPRLREVVTASFFEGRSLTDIGRELGVSESRVSQMRSEALALLRDGMNAQLEPEKVTNHRHPEGPAAKRKAAYFAAVASASDYRSRLKGGSDDIAERIVLSDLGG